MSKAELKSAVEFGKNTIAAYKSRGEDVPEFVYDRLIELLEELADTAV